MRRAGVALLAGAGAWFALASSTFLACSSPSRIGSSSSSGGLTEEAGIPDAAPPEDSPGPPSGYDGGVGLGLTDVEDTPCAARGGSLSVVVAGGDASPTPSFRALQRLGDRRFADAVDGSGFVVFDADGKNAKLVRTSLQRGGATALGGQIVLAGSADLQSGSFQTYDANGAAAGAEVPLTTNDPEGLALGANEQAALAVWATKTNFRARGFATGSAAGTGPYELAIGAKTNTPSVVVSSVKNGLFAVVFSGDDGVRYQTAFGRGSTTARIGDPSNLFTSGLPRTVVGLARAPSGFAMLATIADGPNPYAMLLLMDLGGHRTSSGLKLLGTRAASAVAVNGSEIGVLAHRREGTAFESKITVEFRAFDLLGRPVGPWVCLDTPAAESDLGGGLIADGAGYAALFRSADGSASLARFDHLGTGAP